MEGGRTGNHMLWRGEDYTQSSKESELAVM